MSLCISISINKEEGHAPSIWAMSLSYGKLNKSTIKDWFPIPPINEALVDLFVATMFTNVDMRSEYH